MNQSEASRNCFLKVCHLCGKGYFAVVGMYRSRQIFSPADWCLRLSCCDRLFLRWSPVQGSYSSTSRRGRTRPSCSCSEGHRGPNCSAQLINPSTLFLFQARGCWKYFHRRKPRPPRRSHPSCCRTVAPEGTG